MPTPVGPAPRDPNDPDLWDEWYEPQYDDASHPRFGWPVRIGALLIVIGIASLFTFAR